MECHKEQRVFQESLMGILASVICNTSFSAPRKAACPADFMPSQQDKRPKPKRLTRKQVASNLRIFFSAQIAAQEKLQKERG
jgi:hypothetical protein